MIRNFSRKLLTDNIFSQQKRIGAREWSFERHKLINDASKTPNISLFIISLILDNLRT
jgi:hypothetical protein